ncbi:hypothetical protein T4C_6934, partial [Trichinella pseudospiralis]
LHSPKENIPQALLRATPQGIKKFAYALRLRPKHFVAQHLPLGYPKGLPQAIPLAVVKFA